MKYFLKPYFATLGYILIISAFLAYSCAGTNKQLRKSITPVTKETDHKPESVRSSSNEITELVEKVLPVDQNLPDDHHYFVIIGSFRNHDNAKKYRGQILQKGFTSTTLKNESGLFRVSVLSTDEIETARHEIRRIREVFPEHYDTWLLIQKK